LETQVEDEDEQGEEEEDGCDAEHVED